LSVAVRGRRGSGGRFGLYAIVRAGGKQYKVREDTVLSVEKHEGNAGEQISLSDVLMVSDDSGVKVGTPLVAGASVTAEVVEQYRGKKIRGFTYKPTKNIRRRYGHRQSLTRLRVVEIKAGPAQAESEAAG